MKDRSFSPKGLSPRYNGELKAGRDKRGDKRE